MIRPADADTGAAEPLTLAPDELMCIWHSPASGTFEFLVGAELAQDILNGGMRTINGQPVRVYVVDAPKLGGVHVRATTTEPVQC